MIEQEVIATIQEIQKGYTAQNFENKFVSIIKNYLNNRQNVSYRDMRCQLDIDFSVDMNPIIMYIINSLSISDQSIDTYIKVIDKIKYQYGNMLYQIHQSAINSWSVA